MSKMKIYELAKELNKSSKELMEFLAEKNIEAKSHMSSLEDETVDMVKNALKKPEKEETPKKKNIVHVFRPQNSRDGGKVGRGHREAARQRRQVSVRREAARQRRQVSVRREAVRQHRQKNVRRGTARQRRQESVRRGTARQHRQENVRRETARQRRQVSVRRGTARQRR